MKPQEISTPIGSSQICDNAFCISVHCFGFSAHYFTDMVQFPQTHCFLLQQAAVFSEKL